MKAFKQTVRHYWKYQYNSWTQPSLTSDTSYGTVVSSGYSGGYNPYKMYDGNLSDTRFESSTIPNLVYWELPEEIKVTQVLFYNKYTGGSSVTKTIQLFADKEKTKQLTDVITCTQTSRGLTTITIPSNYQQFSSVFAINFISSVTDLVGSQEVYITAQTRTVVAGTSTDYDFYTDDEAYELPKINDVYYGINT